MGQEESKPLCREFSRNDSGSFIVVSNTLPDTFHFEPSESFAIGYGIDNQSSPHFRHKSLTPITVSDAEQVLHSFVKVGAVPTENTHLFSASKNPESCTTEGMKKTFQDHATKVGVNGLFLFHFSGHGIKVRNDMWGLAPMDFDYSADTYITADVLSQWLNEIECRAKYILITLDCCYAGGIGKELTAQSDVDHDLNLYVLSACTANETSLVLASLGHSIFTYFLSYFIIKLSESNGIIPVKTIFSECQVCCECLSSMIVTYSEESGLQMKMMQPQFSFRNISTQSEGVDVPDAAVPIGRFQYVLELYDHKARIDPLDIKSIAYLDSLKDTSSGPLVHLERRGLLNQRVITSAFCSIVYSMASFELACDTSSVKVKHTNLFITAFMQVASTIDMIHQEVVFDGYTFFLSWLFYREAMKKNNILVKGTSQLEAKLKQLHMSRPRDVSEFVPQRGIDMTDSDHSDEVESLIEEFMHAKWIPLPSEI